MSDPKKFPNPKKDFPNNPYSRYADNVPTFKTISPTFANAYELRTANLLNLIPHVEERDRNALIEEIRERVGLHSIVDRYEDRIASKQEAWDKDTTEVVLPEFEKDD